MWKPKQEVSICSQNQTIIQQSFKFFFATFIMNGNKKQIIKDNPIYIGAAILETSKIVI